MRALRNESEALVKDSPSKETSVVVVLRRTYNNRSSSDTGSDSSWDTHSSNTLSDGQSIHNDNGNRHDDHTASNNATQPYFQYSYVT